jgi:SAM-dependent methyltransferase
MDDTKRWTSERSFFNDEEYSDAPIPAATIERYTRCRKPWLAPELPFHILGDVRDKHILELGCGDGGNAILLALRGARVVGVDISPRAIEIAQHRASLHGVSSRVTFLASPLELFEPRDEDRFDIVCGWAVLHHLIPALDTTLATLKAKGKPNLVMLFSEPVSMSRWLRRLRLMLPIPVHGTPDERPLEPAEIAILRKHVPDLQIRYHNAAVRIVNRFLIRGRYEDFQPFSRAVYDLIARLDEFFLNRLGCRGFASSAAMWGTCSVMTAAPASRAASKVETAGNGL